LSLGPQRYGKGCAAKIGSEMVYCTAVPESGTPGIVILDVDVGRAISV
jgi:hypothetical protein